MTTASTRRFLMLQGPHGPFFGQLADRLRAQGAVVWRAGFNSGDEHFWGRRPGYIPVACAPGDWPDVFGRIAAEHTITDIVLYGDTRPVHAQVVERARIAGLRIHVFEEGYLRPFWATYERGGSNGHSRLMALTVDEMRAALGPCPESPPPPARWGDLREHILMGAVYHFCVLALNGRYPNFRPHRAETPLQECRLYLRRLALLPWHRLERTAATARVRHGGFRYHVVLLQLEHDASFRAHSPFRSMTDFIELCLEGFAAGAAPGDRLVFKAHPLEDGRARIGAAIRRGARRLGLGGRVHFLRGGKLAPLLDGALSAVTVNSTAGQQVLWRGKPLRSFGAAVYDKPGLVSHQPLAEFFASPTPPDRAAYAVFRRFLLETSQLPGGYYAERSRRLLLSRCVARVLSAHDPYEMTPAGEASCRQHFAATG